MPRETIEQDLKVRRKVETRQRSQRADDVSAPEAFRPQADPVNMNLGFQRETDTMHNLQGLNEALKTGASVIQQTSELIEEPYEELVKRTLEEARIDPDARPEPKDGFEKMALWFRKPAIELAMREDRGRVKFLEVTGESSLEGIRRTLRADGKEATGSAIAQHIMSDPDVQEFISDPAQREGFIEGMTTLINDENTLNEQFKVNATKAELDSQDAILFEKDMRATFNDEGEVGTEEFAVVVDAHYDRIASIEGPEVAANKVASMLVSVNGPLVDAGKMDDGQIYELEEQMFDKNPEDMINKDSPIRRAFNELEIRARAYETRLENESDIEKWFDANPEQLKTAQARYVAGEQISEIFPTGDGAPQGTVSEQLAFKKIMMGTTVPDSGETKAERSNNLVNRAAREASKARLGNESDVAALDRWQKETGNILTDTQYNASLRTMRSTTNLVKYLENEPALQRLHVHKDDSGRPLTREEDLAVIIDDYVVNNDDVDLTPMAIALLLSRTLRSPQSASDEDLMRTRDFLEHYKEFFLGKRDETTGEIIVHPRAVQILGDMNPAFEGSGNITQGVTLQIQELEEMLSGSGKAPTKTTTKQSRSAVILDQLEEQIQTDQRMASGGLSTRRTRATIRTTLTDEIHTFNRAIRLRRYYMDGTPDEKTPRKYRIQMTEEQVNEYLNDPATQHIIEIARQYEPVFNEEGNKQYTRNIEILDGLLTDAAGGEMENTIFGDGNFLAGMYRVTGG